MQCTQANGLLLPKLIIIRRNVMKWNTPAYTDIRFGFEITMYIANR